MEEESIKKSDFSACKGIWFPAEIFFNRELTHLEKNLLVDIYYLSNGERGCFKSNKAFADFNGVGVNSIVKALISLRRKGFVRNIAFNGRIRFLTVDVNKFFGLEPLKNSQADYEKNHRQSMKDFIGQTPEKSSQYAIGEQVASPRKMNKDTINNNNRKTALRAELAAVPDFSPTARSAGASAPEPPSLDVEGKDWTSDKSTPENKAERFIQNFRIWNEAHTRTLPAITSNDKRAVLTFFRDNPEFRVRTLTAIMVGAWIVNVAETDPENPGRLKYWYCKMKSKRLFTLIKHLSEIQDEIIWRGSEEQIERTLRVASKKFIAQHEVSPAQEDGPQGLL